jgi:hypothetical protein
MYSTRPNLAIHSSVSCIFCILPLLWSLKNENIIVSPCRKNPQFATTYHVGDSGRTKIIIKSITNEIGTKARVAMRHSGKKKQINVRPESFKCVGDFIWIQH